MVTNRVFSRRKEPLNVTNNIQEGEGVGAGEGGGGGWGGGGRE